MPPVYSKNFKISACEYVTKDGHKPAAVAKLLDIHVNMLYRWMKERERYGEYAFIGAGRKRPEIAHTKRLEEKLAAAEREISLLKKAEAYWTSQRKSE